MGPWDSLLRALWFWPFDTVVPWLPKTRAVAYYDVSN